MESDKDGQTNHQNNQGKTITVENDLQIKKKRENSDKSTQYQNNDNGQGMINKNMKQLNENNNNRLSLGVMELDKNGELREVRRTRILLSQKSIFKKE